MTPQLENICIAIRQPDDSRAVAMMTLTDEWRSGNLTPADAKAAMTALADAAQTHCDTHAMLLLGHMYRNGAHGAPDNDAAFAWFRQATLNGNDHAARWAAGVAMEAAQEHEPDECGPLTMAAIGWAMIARHIEPDPFRQAAIKRGLASMKDEWGLTDSELEQAMTNTTTEIPRIQ